MAVYYKWIKGCQAGAKLASTEGTSDAGLWTYLTWGNGTTGVEQMPLLKANIGKDDNNQAKDFGYFLTSKMPMPLVQTDLRTNKTIYWIDAEYTSDNENFNAQEKSYTWMQHIGNTFTIQPCPGLNQTDNTNIVFFQNGSNQVLQINNYNNRFSTGIKIDSKVTIHDPASVNTSTLLDVNGGVNLGVSGDDYAAKFPTKDETSINFYKELIIHNQPCHAQYFNATSDIRAKKNIKPATYNALELINKLQVYTYNYINQSETVTGIIAQELLDAQPKELDLVSNINASGENGDYMSIKNDKLMFVLMKAIQEQQEEIETLKAELAKLKNN